MPFPILGTPKPAFFDSSGSPLVSGTLAILDPADDTNKASYPTYDDAVLLQNANSNPITLDSRGETTTELWGLDGEDYKLTLKDSTGATIWTADDVQVPVILPYQQTTAEVAAGVTPTNLEYPPGNVLRYGADLTGAADSQSAFQDAIDSSDRVYVPEGDYILNDYVTLRTDTNIVGDGIGATKITKNADTTGSFGLFYANSGASGTFVSNIQLRNFEMDGLVGSKSFSEFQHLVSLNGVADVIIENVKFTGPQGDAIYIGSQGGERHNHNVIIKNNIFDGVNNDNRNAVSIIDGDGVIIANNHFHDFTKSTMPGAIDVEPNANAYHVVSNIEITSNTFENITGSAGVVNFVLTAATFTNQPESFIVSNNIFDVTVTAIVFDSDANYARPIGMVFNNNSGKVANFADFQGRMEGLVYSNNNFYVTGRGYLGFNDADEMINATFSGNVITGDGAALGWAMRSGNNISFSGNVYSGLVSFTYQFGTATGGTLDDVIVSNEIMADGVGVVFGAGSTVAGVSLVNIDFNNASPVISGSIPSDTRIIGCKNWKTTNGGTASVATGGTVSHGLAATPDIVLVIPTTAVPTDVYVSGTDNSTFAINFTGGGTNAFYWLARMEEEYV
jgi:hypothetical protein